MRKLLNRFVNAIEWKFIIIHVKISYFNETTDQYGFSLVKIRLLFHSFHLHLMTFLMLRQYKRSRKIDLSLNINLESGTRLFITLNVLQCMKNVASNAIPESESLVDFTVHCLGYNIFIWRSDNFAEDNLLIKVEGGLAVGKEKNNPDINFNYENRTRQWNNIFLEIDEF